MRAWPVFATVVLLGVALPPVFGQGFDQCGDVLLVFLNPDLQVQPDGFVHVSGTFFIQFQAIGANAASVAKMSFAFGKAFPDGVPACDPVLPVVGPPTDANIPNYRTDTDPIDGFFVPINSTLVPDAEYGASVTAYDASGAYISRFYTKAIVANGVSCATSDVCEDHVQPWPMILPGDGNQTNPIGGITIEYAEFIQSLTVTINDEQVVPENWIPPLRDDDMVSDNDAEDCSMYGPASEIDNRAPCHKTIWGSGYHIAREPKAGDVIKVEALDLAGNSGVKVVTVGGVTQGGAIELTEPELQMTTDTVSQEVAQGGNASYLVKLTNLGTGEAEARMTAEVPDGVTVTWASPTVRVPSGQSTVVGLDALTSKDVKAGRYTIVAVATYKSGTEDKSHRLSMGLEVREDRPVPESPLRQSRVNATDAAASDDAGARKSPDIAPAFAVVAFMAVALVAGRRRRDR